jgi:hypothetical protein
MVSLILNIIYFILREVPPLIVNRFPYHQDRTFFPENLFSYQFNTSHGKDIGEHK